MILSIGQSDLSEVSKCIGSTGGSQYRHDDTKAAAEAAEVAVAVAVAVAAAATATAITAVVALVLAGTAHKNYSRKK